MLISGSCGIIIRGKNELNFDFISKNLMIKPTRIVKKGEIVNESAGVVKSDVWIYEVKFVRGGDINSTLEELLVTLLPYKNVISDLCNYSEICIRCYMQSELAQIGVDFQPNVISMLAELDIKFELSILSWGAVEN